MAKGIELTINEACKHPECFMYVWANDQFLKAINPKYAQIIYVKRANQKKVLMLSADKYLGGFDKVNQYYDAIADAFKSAYDHTPLEALVILAQGGEVAGKNWSEGVYGIGALYPTKFAGVSVGGKEVTVDKETGHILWGTIDITDNDIEPIVDEKGVYQIFGSSDDYIFMSQRKKSGKTFYAATWTDVNGVKHRASDGKEISDSESSNIWGSINLNWDWLKSILNWILSLFGISPIPDIEGSSESLSADNTLPSQKMDGFTSKDPDDPLISSTGALLLLAAGGMLLMNKGKFLKASKRK